MELRSQSRQNHDEEYEELKITLKGMGFFEEQMELKEMQDIMQALQMSEESVLEKENTLPFRNRNANIINSTMIDSYRKRQLYSPESSPEQTPVEFLVEALVHHPMDWSPPHDDSLLLGNSAERNNSMRKRNTEAAINGSDHAAAKRLRYDTIENADSGINLSSHSMNSTNTPQENDIAIALEHENDLLSTIGAAVETVEADNNLIDLNLEELGKTDYVDFNNITNVEDLTELFKYEPNLSDQQPQLTGYHDESESWD